MVLELKKGKNILVSKRNSSPSVRICGDNRFLVFHSNKGTIFVQEVFKSILWSEKIVYFLGGLSLHLNHLIP